MVGSLLLPMVRGVASKAASVLVQTVTRMCGLDDDRDTLELHLLAVERKLASAEERSETDLAVKRWMRKLRAVAYEADDVLDEFEYEALRRKYQIGESKKRKVLSYITHHSPLLFRFSMSTKLKNILQKIGKLVEEMNKFGLESSAPVECATIYGRDDDEKVITKLLLDQRDQRKVQLLPIFGMGGLGKTTLAKMVYNDQVIQQHFQLKMWHCVSDNFDVIALVKSIIELATNGRCNLPDSMDLLQKRLGEVIGQQRFLLVLDDVWNEDERKWEDDLKPLLCSVGASGSAIVVTCRSQKVASVMQTLQPHKLACLNEEDSWELFAQKAFSSGVEEQAELVTIGRRIVKKCRGLPLALKAMSGLLSSYQQVQEWKAIDESNIGDNVRGKDEILPILKLSYKHLSSEMKQCFAFCVVFPKDYMLDKDELIQLWIANGFIQEEGTMDLAQKGELIFHNLVLSLSKMDKLTTLCNNLDVDAEGDITPLQTFPKLIQMSLSELPSLEKWAENSVGEASDRLTKFPVLKRLYIAKCPKLASVPVIPVIKVLSITGVCGIVVGLVCMGILLGSWPFLVSLTVESENNMAMLPLDVQQSRSPVPLEEFKKLILQGPNCLVAASDLSGPHLTLWRCFALVEELDLIRCNNLVHWPTDQLRGLDRLRYLCINSCDNLEGNSSSSRETLPLSLDKMWITNCRSVVALPSKIGDLTKLRILNMNGCSDLKALPDEMDGLTSLEQLWIYRCPGIEEFPHGLLQRLSYLKDLTLKGCPELERRCRQGGEYFHLVSSIPYTCITEAAPESEFSRKKFLRRLLPPCANTKSDAGSDNN
ncbi:hypothetical protein ACQ4PT_067679 [Festuca glaucescens]